GNGSIRVRYSHKLAGAGGLVGTMQMATRWSIRSAITIHIGVWDDGVPEFVGGVTGKIKNANLRSVIFVTVGRSHRWGLRLRVQHATTVRCKDVHCRCAPPWNLGNRRHRQTGGKEDCGCRSKEG